jgi:hypothetical protein
LLPIPQRILRKGDYDATGGGQFQSILLSFEYDDIDGVFQLSYLMA